MMGSAVCAGRRWSECARGIATGGCHTFRSRIRPPSDSASLPALAAAMHLVLPGGRVFSGADAVPELGKLLPGKRWWTWGFAVPGVRGAARRIYRRIAERRHCLVRGLPTPASRG
jgi:hypothetical protein